MSQADDLDHALKGENSCEEDVENVQDVGDIISHFVMVHGHSNHVHKYYNHYAQVKLGAHRDIIEDSLDSSLQTDTNVRQSKASNLIYLQQPISNIMGNCLNLRN